MLIIVFYLNIYHYLTFKNFHQHYLILIKWRNEHYLLIVCTYILLFTSIATASLPGGGVLIPVGGFLFGTFYGGLYALFSLVLGGSIFFILIKNSSFDWVQRKKENKWFKQMKKEIKKNVFYYLLIAQLFPLPYWFVNIFSALLGIRFSIFVGVTALALAPGVFIYAAFGHGLGTIFNNNQEPNLDILFQANILVPLVGIIILIILPVIYKYYTKNRI